MSETIPSQDEKSLTLQKLFVAQSPALRSWFLGLVPDIAMADDLVQETFLTVTKKSADFQTGTNFRAWMYAIARYKLLEACRRHSARAITLEPEAMQALIAEAPELPAASDDHLRCLDACIEKLPLKTRELVKLRYLEELRPPEIAKRTSKTINSVNVTLSRARVLLRNCVENSLAHFQEFGSERPPV